MTLKTAAAVARRLRRGASLEQHPWGHYMLWDEYGGRHCIDVADAAAVEVLKNPNVRMGQFATDKSRYWVYTKENT